MMSVLAQAWQDVSWRDDLAASYEAARARLHLVLEDEDEPEEFL